MARISAGLLMYRARQSRLEVLLVHPGGPFWKSRDAGAWSIPKGEPAPDENPLDAAKREFKEELGTAPRGKKFIDLGEIRQKGGKRVRVWAFEGDFNPAAAASNTFSMQWPPRSGTVREFPEVDQAAWFDPATAREKINPAHRVFLDALENLLASRNPGD